MAQVVVTPGDQREASDEEQQRQQEQHRYNYSLPSLPTTNTTLSMELSTTMNEPLHEKTTNHSSAMTALSADSGSSELSASLRPHHQPPRELSHKATVVTDYSDSTVEDIIDPPPSKLELFRDRLLVAIGGTISKCILAFVVFMIIADGAVFFFLLIGAHTVCDYPSRFNCEPRNEYYNYSIQILNVFISYLAIISFPWKLTHAVHLSPLSGRSCRNGVDLYGQPTEEVFFHIHPCRRRVIVGLLVMNSLAQFVNQSMRIRYYTWELQSTWPGNLLTSGFFLTSFACAITAAIIQVRSESAIRREHPDRFPPGPLQVARKYIKSVFCAKKKKGEPGQEPSNRSEDDFVEEMPFQEREEKERRKMYLGIGKWLKHDKNSLEVWGL